MRLKKAISWLVKQWKKFIIAIILLIIVVYYAGTYILDMAGLDHPLVGIKAPDITIKKLDGTEVSLSSFAGKKAIVLDFWATWCGPCQKALPAMEKLARRYDPNQVAFLAINVWDGDVDAIKDFIKENDIKTVNMFLEKLEEKTDDNRSMETSNKFMFRGIPAIFVLDSNLKIQCYYSGYSPFLDWIIGRRIDKLVFVN
ncbi:MAG TPA: TlpA disulfide reductase family protein [Candidatus Hydrogenedens sp.]|nr:TlpA disulfide reductase family protein [Candidatus Hydrogenedens sp.]